MEVIFIELLNRSITVGWLVLAVLALRLILKKVPKKYFVILWALVGIRLLLPFSLESSWSLVPSTQTVSRDILTAEQPAINSGISVLDEVVNPAIKKVLAPEKTEAAGKHENQTAVKNSTEKKEPESRTERADVDKEKAVNPAKQAAFAAAIVWVSGVVAMLSYALFSWIRIRRRVAVSLEVKKGIRECDYIRTPFILGVFHPVIYVPSDLSASDYSYIIAHEKAHLARRDHLWKPLGFLLLSVFWFHPLIWVAYILLCRDIECACDERVLQILGREERKNYASALLDMSVPRRMILASPLAFGEVNVKQRINNVLRYQKAKVGLIIAVIAVCLVFVACFMTDPDNGTMDETSRGTKPSSAKEDPTESEPKWEETRESESIQDTTAESSTANSSETEPVQTETKKSSSLSMKASRMLVERYVDDILHCIEEGGMQCYLPQDFASINGYLVVKSIIDDRFRMIDQYGEGKWNPHFDVRVLESTEKEDGTVLVEAEGTTFYSDGFSNHQIQHRYTVTLAWVENEWCCVDIDTQNDEKIQAIKEQLAGLPYEEQIAYIDRTLQGEEEGSSLEKRRAVFEYAEEVFNSVNQDFSTSCKPENYETVAGYLAAKYYQTLREEYIMQGYPISDHCVTGVVLNGTTILNNVEGREHLLADVVIACTYTDPGMQMIQHYGREMGLVLEKTGENTYRVAGVQRFGAAEELQEALRGISNREEQTRYIDAHVRDAVINDGMLPMDNR